MGFNAGQTSQGINAGNQNQGNDSVAIRNARQQANSIAIGQSAGYTGQGNNSIAIGNNAGLSGTSANTIILNL